MPCSGAVHRYLLHFRVGPRESRFGGNVLLAEPSKCRLASANSEQFTSLPSTTFLRWLILIAITLLAGLSALVVVLHEIL